MVDVQEGLRKLMGRHGLSVFDDGGALAVQGNPARIEARIVREMTHPQTLVVQLDVNTTLQDGLVIIESCAGTGSTRDDATLNALKNFSIYSLHVLLAAVWNRIEPSQVEIETWNVSGVSWQVVLGPCAMRHQPPDGPTLPQDAFPLFQRAIVESPLDGDWNWFRWYYADSKVSPLDFEALKNNEPWPPGIEALRKVRWPIVTNFWSARQFLVLKRMN